MQHCGQAHGSCPRRAQGHNVHVPTLLHDHLKNTPIFIIAKDRKSYLEILIERLCSDGLKKIIVIDTGSTYGPMLDYQATLKQRRIQVLRVIPKGLPHRVLWDNDILSDTGCKGVRFVLTDCDVVPDAACPVHWLFRLDFLLTKHNVIKAGLGLRLDDLPDHYDKKQQVLEWERKWNTIKIEDDVYSAQVDTTLALYKPNESAMEPALRTGHPYLARHLPWYEDSKNPSEELQQYRRNYDGRIGHWR